jgi:hypothetical protein
MMTPNHDRISDAIKGREDVSMMARPNKFGGSHSLFRMQRLSPEEMPASLLARAGANPKFGQRLTLRVLVGLPIEKPLCSATWAGLSKRD